MSKSNLNFTLSGEKHIEKRWLNFDECNKEKGVDEEVVKNLAAGGEQPLRKNHQGDTLTARWLSFLLTCVCILLIDADLVGRQEGPKKAQEHTKEAPEKAKRVAQCTQNEPLGCPKVNCRAPTGPMVPPLGPLGPLVGPPGCSIGSPPGSTPACV